MLVCHSIWHDICFVLSGPRAAQSPEKPEYAGAAAGSPGSGRGRMHTFNAMTKQWWRQGRWLHTPITPCPQDTAMCDQQMLKQCCTSPHHLCHYLIKNQSDTEAHNRKRKQTSPAAFRPTHPQQRTPLSALLAGAHISGSYPAALLTHPTRLGCCRQACTQHGG